MATLKGQNMHPMGSIFCPLIIAHLVSTTVETYSIVQKLIFDDTDANIPSVCVCGSIYCLLSN